MGKVFNKGGPVTSQSVSVKEELDETDKVCYNVSKD